MTAPTRLRGGWGRPVLKAVCDHQPYRLRLHDAAGKEIPLTYFECRRCHVPLFMGANDRPVEIVRANECGCIWPTVVCSFHGHPVNA